MNCKHLLIVLVLTINLSVISGNDSDIVNVKTLNGVVNGRTEVWSDKRVNVFFGIPYAEPPINQLRFKRPVAVKNWSQPLNATQMSMPCYQRSHYPTLVNVTSSEDCLYLNIWQPINTTESGDELKAVLFHIHAGGFEQGSASEFIYQGQFLSTIGDVVVVTINYRLNVFGFLYTGTDDAPGNVGFWDMILSLEWVRDNIQYFGGDPNRVTIFGSVSGSRAVCALILSKYSRELFSNAVLMSGALISSPVINKTQAIDKWLSATKAIGCAQQSDQAFNSQIINCLIGMNASDLAAIIPVIGYPLEVMIDGKFMEKSPVELLESGAYNKNLNLLIGTCENEASGSLPNTPLPLTYSEYFESLVNSAVNIPTYGTIDGLEVANMYYALISPNSTDYALLAVARSLASADGRSQCPSKYFGEAVLRNSHNQSSVYQYYYTSKVNVADQYNDLWLDCKGINWTGTCYCSDLYPVFGMPFLYSNISSQFDLYDSEQTITFYAHFAKYGYPASQNGIPWPKYYMLNSNIVTPYFTLNNTHQTKSSFFNYGLKTTECEYLWKNSIYVKVPNSSKRIKSCKLFIIIFIGYFSKILLITCTTV